MEDEKLKAICDKLTNEELEYLTYFICAKIIEKHGIEIAQQYGK